MNKKRLGSILLVFLLLLTLFPVSVAATGTGGWNADSLAGRLDSSTYNRKMSSGGWGYKLSSMDTLRVSWAKK